jgi:RNA polymerase sigma-70 factor, ECF subfamily
VWMERLAIATDPGEVRTAVAEDSELIARIRSGDAGAFETLIARHQNMVGGLAFRLLGSTRDVDDLVQDVFLAVLLNVKKFRGDCALSTWLAQIAVNRCRTRLKRQERRRRWLGRFRREKAETSEDPPAGEAVERRQLIRQAVYRLPEKYCTPIVLRYFEHQEIERIAEVLQLSRNAVEVRLNRAREKLKGMLSNTIPSPTGRGLG